MINENFHREFSSEFEYRTNERVDWHEVPISNISVWDLNGKSISR